MTEVLDAMLNNGMVDYSEHGTSRVDDAPADDETAKKAFSEKVKEIASEDKLDVAAATRVASEKYPELAQAYAAATRTRR